MDTAQSAPGRSPEAALPLPFAQLFILTLGLEETGSGSTLFIHLIHSLLGFTQIHTQCFNIANTSLG